MSDKERDELAREIFLADNRDIRTIAAQEWARNERPEYVYGIADTILAAGYRKRPQTTAEWAVAYPDSNSVDYIGTALYAEHAFDEEEDAHENVQLVRREVTAWDVVRTSTVDADEDLEAGGA